MITPVLWTLIAVQVAMGGFDTLVHHEATERLAWRPSQRRELLLHGTRNLIYAVLFLLLGWAEPRGLFALVVVALLVVEMIITLADFVEEDLSRKLPATERINHTLLALSYGAILVLLVPVLLEWSRRATGVAATSHGAWSAMAPSAAIGVALFGLRDLFAMSRSSGSCRRGPATSGRKDLSASLTDIAATRSRLSPQSEGTGRRTAGNLAFEPDRHRDRADD